MSLGGGVYNPINSDFYKSIYEEDGVLIVAAAGNSGPGEAFPASFDSVLSVGAVDENKNIASFSGTNNEVELTGPGVDVYSTLPNNGYDYFSGTSMACPHVAGVAALVWSHFPYLSAVEIRDVLKKSAEDLGSVGKDPEYGYGLVRAKEAFDLLNSTDSYSLSPSVSPTECLGVVLAVTIETDFYGNEISWDVTKNEEIVLSGGLYGGNRTYSESVCVEACDQDAFDGPYTFSIFDSYGDGIGGGDTW
jgi:subtilisin family serine protease